MKEEKIKYGMVGGGPGAFIGEIHRKAAALDGEIELVAGAFSSDPEKSILQGNKLLLDTGRVYKSYQEMAENESKLPKDKKIDFVSIVTPNNSHFQIIKSFIDAGINILCDKPLAITIEEAEEINKLVKKNNIIFGLTYNYTGYPMVKQAREIIKLGKIGKIRKLVIEYPQGWLSTYLEGKNMKQAVWRTDPKKAGISGCIGDIGSHSENLIHYIARLQIEEIFSDLTIFVPKRKLEDDGNVLIHFKEGARGILYASQISAGEENNHKIRVYGEKGSIEWQHDDQNSLHLKMLGEPELIYKRGNDYLEEIVKHNTRLPSGHPEAFIEAFSNIYLNFARTIKAIKNNKEPNDFDLDFPKISDGVRGVYFINQVVESSNKREWVNFNFKY